MKHIPLLLLLAFTVLISIAATKKHNSLKNEITKACNDRNKKARVENPQIPWDSASLQNAKDYCDCVGEQISIKFSAEEIKQIIIAFEGESPKRLRDTVVTNKLLDEADKVMQPCTDAAMKFYDTKIKTGKSHNGR